MLLRMLELKMQVDEIRYFDCGKWEFPAMKRHIKKVELYIGREIKHIKPPYSLDYFFSERITRQGIKGYSWARVYRRWCMGLKTRLTGKGISKDDIMYLGFSMDEIKRLQKHVETRKKKTAFPLVGWGWSSRDCLDYCYRKGFDWEGLYKYFSRVSCWCCPFQRVSDLKNLRKHFPVLWRKLEDMQKGTDKPFMTNGVTVLDFERRFAEEDKG